jgi:hypothetical protein
MQVASYAYNKQLALATAICITIAAARTVNTSLNIVVGGAGL